MFARIRRKLIALVILAHRGLAGSCIIVVQVEVEAEVEYLYYTYLQ